TMDSLGFLKERLPGAFILADARLYTYSDRTQDALTASGIAANTIPYELNRGELQHRKNENSFFTVYGYTPLMYMANCTHKNCQGCDHVPGRMILRDRYGNPFTMVNSCEICTNILYNYLPTNLIGEADASALRALGDRLDFTLESAKDVEVILKQYETKSRDNATQAYTKGHYGRGVE
ncbi:MAG: U32 family peptidase, partial [Lachnospiraceae bacterium]|nr:U32 family peptidase [Lachnospiraceae bacterium]